MPDFIILLTDRQRLGAEMFAVSTDGRVARATDPRSYVKRFASMDAAERFVATHEGQGVFAPYRMFVSDGGGIGRRDSRDDRNGRTGRNG